MWNKTVLLYFAAIYSAFIEGETLHIYASSHKNSANSLIRMLTKSKSGFPYSFFYLINRTSFIYI